MASPQAADITRSSNVTRSLDRLQVGNRYTVKHDDLDVGNILRVGQRKEARRAEGFQCAPDSSKF